MSKFANTYTSLIYFHTSVPHLCSMSKLHKWFCSSEQKMAAIAKIELTFKWLSSLEPLA